MMPATLPRAMPKKKKTPGNRTKVLSTLKVPRSRIILNSTEEIAQYEYQVDVKVKAMIFSGNF